jgi:hypothetical protein
VDISQLRVETIHQAFSPAKEIHDPRLFVGRIDEVNAGIHALLNPGGFLSIFGLRGVGKSSVAYQISLIAQGNTELPKLLRMDRLLPSKGFNYLVHYRRCDGFVKDVPGLITRLLYDDESNKSLFSLTKAGARQLTEFKRVLGVEGSGGIFGTKIGAKGTEEKKYQSYVSDDILQQFRGLLGTIRRDNQNKTGLLILIDEFDTIENKAGFASIVKACSSDFVKFGIVGIASNTTELIRDHSSIGRQIDSISVPVMPESELQGILTKAEFVVSKAIRFTDPAKHTIARLSEGFPYFTHLLGKEAMLNAFLRGSPMVDETDIASLQAQITGGRLNTIYESFYHEAVKTSPQRELLLKAFSERKEEEILSEPVYALAREMGITNPSQLMTVLTTPGTGTSAVLTKVREKCYRFTDPVFKTYARMRQWKFE